MGVEAKVYELDNMDDGAAIQAALGEMTGQRTVPNVFIAGKHLGGNSEVQTANGSGALKELLGL
jgi:glutaredoxin 3